MTAFCSTRTVLYQGKNVKTFLHVAYYYRISSHFSYLETMFRVGRYFRKQMVRGGKKNCPDRLPCQTLKGRRTRPYGVPHHLCSQKDGGFSSFSILLPTFHPQKRGYDYITTFDDRLIVKDMCHPFQFHRRCKSHNYGFC